MRKLFQLCLAVCLLLAGQVFGQEHRVSGQVISGENRDALIGVNISVKDTDRGTITDIDGRYQLEVASPQDILIFSYIGHRIEEIPINGQEVIDIVMTPQALSGADVVVIGYGTQQRKDITSSIYSLKEGSFTQGANTDVQSMLAARVPGVVITSSNGDVGAQPLIRIRGGTSVNASNGPMIVIDGVPIDNESALPEAVYPGAQFGEENEISSGTRDNPLGMVNPEDIASINILKDASAAAIYGARGGNGVILITTKEGKPGGVALSYDTYTRTATVSKKLDLLDAKEYKAFATSVGAEPLLGNADTDWQDEVFRTAVSQNHNLSFGGGTQVSKYLVSLNYLDEQGIVLGSERQRYSLRLNVNHKMLDEKLTLGLKINPTFIKRHNTPYNQKAGYFGGVFTNILKMNPTLPVYNDDGSYYEYETTTIRNPVALAKEISDVSENLRIFFNATAEYEFLTGLIGKVNVGLDRSSTTRGQYVPNSLPFAASYGGKADIKNNDRQSVLLESTLNYRTDIGASQKLEAWAGYTFQEFENGGFGAFSRDYVVDAWGYYNLGGGADFTEYPYSYRNRNRLISFLGRVNYNIAGKYLVSAAMRREGSSRFGDDNEWGVFPSASLGWRLSEEPFIKGIKNLDDLKVRVSYGVTGNQDIGNYKSLVILGTGQGNAVIGGEIMTGVAATQLANPDLKWEETTQTNFGIDFSLLQDRLSGSVDVYTKKTEDLLLEFDVPQPAVVTTRLGNAGTVENKGLEVMLNTVNISTGDLFWRTAFNFASNKNEVVDLGDRDYIFTGDVGGSGLSGVFAQIILPGEPLGTFFGYKFEGYDSDGNEILSSEGGPLDDGRYILGDAQPDFTFGITNMVTYKSVDFSIFIQGVQGVEILNNTRLEYQRPANLNTSINMFADAVDDVADGLGTDAGVTYTDRFIEDGSFIRLQNITVGYTLKTAQVKKLRLYFSADNLFLLTDYKGYDPEVNTFTGQAIGIDYTNYPKARTFTIGLNIGL